MRYIVLLYTRKLSAYVMFLALLQKSALDEAKRLEMEVLMKETASVRKYLSQHIMPTLTRGLIELCNDRPQDPVDFLVRLQHRPHIYSSIYSYAACGCLAASFLSGWRSCATDAVDLVTSELVLISPISEG